MNLAYQYIDRPNGKNGSTYGAFLLYMGGETVCIQARGRDIHRLWSYVGNGNRGIGKERLREFMELPSFTLNPAQYNMTVSQYRDSSSVSFNTNVMPKKGH